MATDQIMQQYLANLYTLYKRNKLLQTQMGGSARPSPYQNMQPGANQQPAFRPSPLLRGAERTPPRGQGAQRMPYASGMYDPMATLKRPQPTPQPQQQQMGQLEDPVQKRNMMLQQMLAQSGR